jgi:hypothetical protein
MLDKETIDALPPKEKPYKVYDTANGPKTPGAIKGLHLVVTPRNNKWWRIKYRLEGKEKQLSVGVWPTVTCSQARLAAQHIRKQLLCGYDPSAERKRQKERDKLTDPSK